MRPRRGAAPGERPRRSGRGQPPRAPERPPPERGETPEASTPRAPEISAAEPADEVIAELVESSADEVDAAALATTPAPGLPVRYDPLARYLQEVRRFPELTRDEEQLLARRYRETGDREAARRLITAHLALVVKLALMYRQAIRNVMDLIQEGNIGLLEALKRFDPGQGVRFPTYAAWWIKAYMLKFLMDNARLVRVGTTNARRKLLYNLRREQARLLQQGVAVTPKLLAERFGVAEADVIEVDQAIRSPDVSVDAPVTEDGAVTVGDTLAAATPSVEETVSAEEMRSRVAAAISAFRQELAEREQALLDARLAAEEPITLQELGDRFGVTREAMRQAEARLKERLAAFLKQRLGEDFILRFTGQS